MTSSRQPVWRLFATYLAIAGVLYRGMIPVGFMPADAAAMRRGEVYVVCPHGTMAMHVHGDKAARGGIEQCPFGSASAPSLPGVTTVLPLAQHPPSFGPGWISTPHLRLWAPLHPPVRGPPARS